MSNEQFKKFINPKNNAAVKEKFKQEKKTAKKQRAEAINKRFEEKRALKNIGYASKTEVPAFATKAGKRQKYPRASSLIKHAGPLKQAGNPKKGSHLQSPASPAQMPLNKFIAHCGVTSRRDAIPLIREGKITVNGNVIVEPGFKVTGADDVMHNGKRLYTIKNQVYILLNKPKRLYYHNRRSAGKKNCVTTDKTGIT